MILSRSFLSRAWLPFRGKSFLWHSSSNQMWVLSFAQKIKLIQIGLKSKKPKLKTTTANGKSWINFRQSFFGFSSWGGLGYTENIFTVEIWDLGTWSLRCTNSDVIIIIHYYQRHHHNHRHHVKRQCSAPVLMIEFGKFCEKLNCWRQKVPTKKTSLHRRERSRLGISHPFNHRGFSF